MSASLKKHNPSGSNCKPYFNQFINCVKESDCVRKEGLSLKECSKREDLSEDCQKIWSRWFACKRGLMDARNRMRGNREL